LPHGRTNTGDPEALSVSPRHRHGTTFPHEHVITSSPFVLPTGGHGPRLFPKCRTTTLWPTFTWRFRRLTRRFELDKYVTAGVVSAMVTPKSTPEIAG